MKDNFSVHSALYAQFRPHYPKAMFEHILQFVNGQNIAWDCATGNGQAAGELAKYFNTVYATDISARQIENATKAGNIIYKIESAENCSFSDNTFDLITVAQAIHWFDFERFYAAVKRVGKHNSIIAVLGYGLVDCNKRGIQHIIQHFYKNIVGPYWDKERKYIDENYRTIPFPFEELPAIECRSGYEWNLELFTGYLQTWSAVQHYIKTHRQNPVDLIMKICKMLGNWQATRFLVFLF